MLLGGASYEVQVAASGNDGIALVEKERPDLSPHSTERSGRFVRSSSGPTINS